MKTYPNGTRYDYTKFYDETLNSPYDYASEGLARHIMSNRIVNSQNPITRFVVNVLEQNVVLLLKLTEYLANFKNPHFRNR